MLSISLQKSFTFKCHKSAASFHHILHTVLNSQLSHGDMSLTNNPNRKDTLFPLSYTNIDRHSFSHTRTHFHMVSLFPYPPTNEHKSFKLRLILLKSLPSASSSSSCSHLLCCPDQCWWNSLNETEEEKKVLTYMWEHICSCIVSINDFLEQLVDWISK